VVENFRQLAKTAADQSLTVLIENLPKEKNGDKVGLLPQEVLQVIKAVNMDNLKFCFDIGHGTLSANQYGFNILDFVTMLSPYLHHMHIHDNQGIPEDVDSTFGDQHLPLGQGKVEYQKIFQAITGLGVKNAVLELRRDAGRAAAQKSISILSALKKQRPY
jgi:sugar phosphate isomerase/epimerase